MFSKDAAVLQGTIELLVLKRVSWGPMHGYGIASWIETATDDVLCVEEGSLYPALYRMVQKKWIKGQWGVSENNRRAKFYRLTPAGQREYELGAGVTAGLAMAMALDWSGQDFVSGGNLVVLVPSVGALMFIVGLLAALGPARRGLAVQPTEALREE